MSCTAMAPSPDDSHLHKRVRRVVHEPVPTRPAREEVPGEESSSPGT